MLELAERVVQLVDSAVKLVFRPLPEDDPRQLSLDDRLARTLGWFRPTQDAASTEAVTQRLPAR